MNITEILNQNELEQLEQHLESLELVSQLLCEAYQSSFCAVL